MPPDQMPGLLKFLSLFAGLLACVLLAAFLLTRRRRTGYDRAWAPLRRVVRGRIRGQQDVSTLSGAYRGRQVLATISRVGRDAVHTFSVQIRVGRGGRDWEIARRSEQMLGPERWRILAKDPALHARLESCRAHEYLRGWPAHTVVRYDAGRGTLSLEEQILAPSADHFRAQLELLDGLARINEEVNT